MRSFQIAATFTVIFLSSVVVVLKQDLFSTPTENQRIVETSFSITLRPSGGIRQMMLPDHRTGGHYPEFTRVARSGSEVSDSVIGSIDARELFPLNQMSEAVEELKNKGRGRAQSLHSPAQATILRGILDDSKRTGPSTLEEKAVLPVFK